MNLLMEDLPYRFNIAPSTVGDTFSKYTESDVLHAHVKFMIEWPAQETCRANVPQVFKDLYPKTRCIIDCSEIFIERPCSFQARAQNWKNFDKNHTSRLFDAKLS